MLLENHAFRLSLSDFERLQLKIKNLLLHYRDIGVRAQDDYSKLRHLFEEGLHLFFLFPQNLFARANIGLLKRRFVFSGRNNSCVSLRMYGHFLLYLSFSFFLLLCVSLFLSLSFSISFLAFELNEIFLFLMSVYLGWGPPWSTFNWTETSRHRETQTALKSLLKELYQPEGRTRGILSPGEERECKRYEANGHRRNERKTE